MTEAVRLKREIAWKQKAKEIHSDKYDYSESVYHGSEQPIMVRCKEHGLFEIKAAYLHTRKIRPVGCPYCLKEPKYTIDDVREFVEKKSKGKWKVLSSEYSNNKRPLDCECSVHGKFRISWSSLLQGKGCRYCGIEHRALLNRKSDSEIRQLIQEADVYNQVILLDNEDYAGVKVKHIFKCPEHGEYISTPENVLLGLKNGNSCCPICRNLKCSERLRRDKEDVITQMSHVHNGLYEYDLNTYVDMKTKIKMVCKLHGEFWQTPQVHLSGCGCPVCRSSRLEKSVADYCKSHGIRYIPQWKPDWLKPLRCDFYLPDYDAVIECQGLQHFEPIDFYGGIKQFNKRQKADNKKLTLCLEHGIKVFYFSDTQYDTFMDEPVYHRLPVLFQAINGLYN